MRPEFLVFLALYLAALVAIGLAFSRRMKSLEDFFLASRSLPPWLVFLSLTASWFGATSILVTTDDAYRRGLSAVWLVGVPAIVTVLIFGVFLAGPIRRLDIVTLPDLVEKRYGTTVRYLASLLIFWYMVVLASSQMVALGQFLGPFLNVPYIWSLAAGTGIVLVYLLKGGLFSVVATDVFQCLLLGGGVLGLASYLGRRTPIIEALRAGAAAADGRLDPFSNLGTDLLMAASFVLAWTISPIAWQRVQAAATVKKARRGFLAAAGTFVVLYGLVALIGILAGPLFDFRELANPLVSELILSGAGGWLGGILFVAVVAAILSTMDTALNTGALTLTRDVYFRIVAHGARGRLAEVAAGRAATVLMAALTFLVATRFRSILHVLGLSSEIMAEGLFVPGVAMIWLRDRRPLAGGLSLALGGGFALAGFLSVLNVLPVRIPSWPHSVPYGVGLSSAGFVIGYALDSLRHHRSSRESPLE
jgi:solute:Na+ symporter, SSS family